MVVPDLVVEAPPGANVTIKAVPSAVAGKQGQGLEPGQGQGQGQQSDDPACWGINPEVINGDKIDWESLRRDQKVLAIALLNTNDEESRASLDHLSLLHQEFKTTNKVCILGLTDECDKDKVCNFVHDRELEIKFPFAIDCCQPTLTERLRDSINDKKTLPLAIVYDQNGNRVWCGEPRKLGLETTLRELVSSYRGEEAIAQYQQQQREQQQQAGEERGECQPGQSQSQGGLGGQQQFADEQARLEEQRTQQQWPQGSQRSAGWTGAESGGKQDDQVGAGWERGGGIQQQQQQQAGGVYEEHLQAGSAGAGGWTGAEARGKQDDQTGAGWERRGELQQQGAGQYGQGEGQYGQQQGQQQAGNWQGSEQLGYPGAQQQGVRLDQAQAGAWTGSQQQQQQQQQEQQQQQGVGSQQSGGQAAGFQQMPERWARNEPYDTSKMGAAGIAGEQPTSRWATNEPQQGASGGQSESMSGFAGGLGERSGRFAGGRSRMSEGFSNREEWSEEKLHTMTVPELQDILRQKGDLSFAGVTDKNQLVRQIRALPNIGPR